jgi:hypothetical protein
MTALLLAHIKMSDPMSFQVTDRRSAEAVAVWWAR